MSDLVERLRQPVRWRSGNSSPDPLMVEAADEIERLRAALKEVKEMTPNHYAREHAIIDAALSVEQKEDKT